jgi:signal transduction histidine kinase
VLDVNLTAGDGRVMMEGGTLQQVLLNLVVNAREALRGEGRVSVTTRNVTVPVRYDDTAEQKFVEIDIADTGIGMTPSVRDHVFELYFTTKEDRRGSGIGLATVYAFVRDAGGTISVDSELGQGTTFRIRLPLAGPQSRTTGV